MSGPEHFASAESALEHAAHASDKGLGEDLAYWLGCAQVHATLALAAATADPVGSMWQDKPGSLPPGSEMTQT